MSIIKTVLTFILVLFLLSCANGYMLEHMIWTPNTYRSVAIISAMGGIISIILPYIIRASASDKVKERFRDARAFFVSLGISFIIWGFLFYQAGVARGYLD